MAALSDDSAEIVAAGAWAMNDLANADSVGRLKEILDKDDPQQAILPAIMAPGHVKTAGSADALVDFMAAALEDSKRSNEVFRALYALQDVTGQWWLEAVRHDPSYYDELAKEAIKWWHAQHGHLPTPKNPRFPGCRVFRPARHDLESAPTTNRHALDCRFSTDWLRHRKR